MSEQKMELGDVVSTNEDSIGEGLQTGDLVHVEMRPVEVNLDLVGKFCGYGEEQVPSDLDAVLFGNSIQLNYPSSFNPADIRMSMLRHVRKILIDNIQRNGYESLSGPINYVLVHIGETVRGFLMNTVDEKSKNTAVRILMNPVNALTTHFEISKCHKVVALIDEISSDLVRVIKKEIVKKSTVIECNNVIRAIDQLIELLKRFHNFVSKKLK